MQNIFVPPHDPILLKVAAKVDPNEIASKEIRKIVESMFQIAYGEQKDAKKPVMVGLAAPQIGISKRIILVDVGANGINPPNPLSVKGVPRGAGDLRIYINPEIVWQSEEEGEWYEGCYSTDRVCGIVSRPTKIKVRALNREGESIEEEYEGYTARIFLHEIDHLDGKVFVDHITDDEKLHWVEKDEFPLYRNNEGWRDWSKKCTRREWKQLKNGTLH